ncbi:MAG: FAD-binding protein [Actinobacteria bacterium]|nr:FAD-binding protein [Actinomycetota bacterium]
MSVSKALRAALGGDCAVIDDEQILASYERDQAPFAPSSKAAAVLIAKSIDEVSKAVKFANQESIPVVVRGAGSGLAGGANSIQGCIVISTEKLSRILEIDPINQIARVEAGVINSDLDKAAEEFGLTYLPDPASRSWSTIGGNIATNAGGMCCIKYGVTSQHVRAIRVVLSDGEVVDFGFPTKKSVTTLDLLHLFIGSEGTLGVVVEATLSLVPRLRKPVTLIATFPSVIKAADAAIEMLTIRPSMLELIDKTTLSAVEEWKPMGFESCESVLIMQSDESADDCQKAQEIALKHGAIDAIYSDDPKDSDDLIQVRKLAYSSLERLGVALIDDVVVPVSKISQLVSGIENIAARNSVKIGVFGHAGDGNMHPTIIYPHNDKGAEARALRAFNEIIALAQGLGGTASGEHGIGGLKISALLNETPERILKIQREIKSILDPNRIFNPGKKFPI